MVIGRYRWTLKADPSPRLPFPAEVSSSSNECRLVCIQHLQLDDIIVLGSTFQEHLENLRNVFQRLRARGLRLQVEKCSFCQSELKYLGHLVNNQGIQPDKEKIDAISDLSAPTTTKQLRRFLGMASWYRKFVPGFAQIAAPLTNLLSTGLGLSGL